MVSPSYWRGAMKCLFLLWMDWTFGVLASDINTLMGLRGLDFVLLGGDSAFFRSVVLMDSEYRKVVELTDNMVVAASGEQGDVEVFVEWLKRNIRLMELESARPCSVATVAHFARRNTAEKLRKQGSGQAVTALLGGWDEIASKPELFWLDALGALQSIPFGAHGLASRFALSLLDNGYREGMSLDEARDLMQACFRQLDKRYLVSSVGFSMKVVDRHGCRDVSCKAYDDKIETHKLHRRGEQEDEKEGGAEGDDSRHQAIRNAWAPSRPR